MRSASLGFDFHALRGTPRRRLRLSASFGSLREWVFVQKCSLDRKRAYLTEKGLFSRKAPEEAGKIAGGNYLQIFRAVVG